MDERVWFNEWQSKKGQKKPTEWSTAWTNDRVNKRKIDSKSIKCQASKYDENVPLNQFLLKDITYKSFENITIQQY